MSQYLLLLYHDPQGMKQLSPEEMQKAVEKYMTWAKKPFVRVSQRLSPDAGKVMRAGAPPRVFDGPYSETKEVLGGFYVIEAPNYEEAVRLTMDHPHLTHGTIEVRQYWQ